MQLKKILAIFLAVALTCSAMLIGVSAEDTETFKVGVEAVAATPISSSPTVFGRTEDVLVKIGVSQNTGISFLRFIVTYDAEAFEYIGHSSSRLFGEGESIRPDNGYIHYYLDLSNGISTGTGSLFEFTLRPKEGFCGTTEITAELVQGRESNCSKYHLSAANTAVPFESGTAGMQIHTIDTAAGVVTAPTCLAEGFTTYECDNCGTVIGNILPATGHTFADDWTVDAPPTCTEAGSQSHPCTACGEKADVTEMPALGHNWTAAGHQDATCIADGYDAYVCAHDDTHTQSEVLPATGHTYSTDWTVDAEPTCTEAGSQSHPCTACGDKADVTAIPATGHAFGNWTVETAPTLTAEGTEVRACGACSEEERRAIPRLEGIRGDLDGNGRVEAADALLALQIATAKVAVTDAYLAAGDVDTTPGITANDALLILQCATQKIAAL